jgi:hypothetical protein
MWIKDHFYAAYTMACLTLLVVLVAAGVIHKW